MSTGGSLDVDHTVDGLDLIDNTDQFLSAADLKGCGHRGKSLFAGSCIHGQDIDILFRQSPGDIGKQTVSVVGVDLDLRKILSS